MGRSPVAPGINSETETMSEINEQQYYENLLQHSIEVWVPEYAKCIRCGERFLREDLNELGLCQECDDG